MDERLNERPDEHRLPIKVYLEDTDAQRIVFHASYIRFFERGRTEYLAARGGDLAALERAGRHVVVYELRVKYRRTAQLGERLEVVSRSRPASPYRLTFEQRVERPGDPRPVCDAEVEVVCLDDRGRPVRFPPELLQASPV